VNSQAALLARRLADIQKTTMTQAVVSALEKELRREQTKTPLAERICNIAVKAKAMAGPGRREMTKDDIDALSD